MAALAASKRTVTVIAGDGIGPEVVRASLRLAEAAGAKATWEYCEAGMEVFKKGLSTGVPEETLQSIQRTGVVLKGPLETPIGKGENSANVTLRKYFETYGNVRPVRELPGIITPFSGRGVDLVVVRENVEDLYAGIEYMQTPNVAQCLKLMSRKGCEKITRLAFEIARAESRKTVHCTTKANIMKLTEGFMKRVFEEVAKDYPEIEPKHLIVDNCAYQLVRAPESFEVIVASNMNGDILSDLTSGLVGGLGVAASANLGAKVSMFEAVHGSAPDLAGKDMANPTALMLSAVFMLRHIGDIVAADRMEGALMATLEQGAFTGDLTRGKPGLSTTQFTERVIANLGKGPTGWAVRSRKTLRLPEVSAAPDILHVGKREVVGVDVFVESALDAVALGTQIDRLVRDLPFKLKIIANRGTRVYPPASAMPDLVDHWRCRFVMREAGHEVVDAFVGSLLDRLGTELRWMHVEKLNRFDDVDAFSRAQGEI